MQQKFTFLPALTLLVLMQLFAWQTLQAQGDPGTDDDGFVVKITSSGGLNQELVHGYNGLGCNWVGSSYGPSLTSDVCGQVVWAEDDSLGCATLQDLTGKIALIRRGICGFSLKVYNAQQAGAVGVIVVNHYANATDGPCSAFGAGGLIFGGMSGLDSAALVNIPSVFVHRQTGEDIDAALAAGQTVEACFLPTHLYSPAAAYHYATPVTQVDTLFNIGVRYVNRAETAQENVVLKADIKEPDGNVTTLTATLNSVTAGLDSFYYFPPYLPPSVLGRFDVAYSNSVYTESRDTIYRSFQHTPFSFANDNLTIDPGGVAWSADAFASYNFQEQYGALYLSGQSGGEATHGTFGIANAAAVAGTGADDITVILYDGDPDDDGIIDMVSGFTDLDNLQGGQVGFAIYTMTGVEPADTLISVELSDFAGTGVPITLKPRHPYYLSLLYNGANGTSGLPVAFSNSTDEYYLNFPSTPVFLDQFYSGITGSVIIQRLQLQGYPANLVEVKPELLDASKVVVTPNPANDQLRLDLNLAKVNDKVTVSLIDWTGRFVSTQVLKNFQSGQTSFDVSALPSGTYLVQVSSKEGNTMRKVAICH